MTAGTTTLYLEGCLNRLRAGEASARGDLLRHSLGRLELLTHRMLVRFPGVKRFEETADVLQNVLLRLNKMLEQMEVASVRDYLRLAAANIRRELIDLTRHYYGPLGIGANQVAQPAVPLDQSDRETLAGQAGGSDDGALSLAEWTAFHEQIAQLSEEEHEVFDLLWYHGLAQDEAAELLGISLSTLKRRWQTARLGLMESLGGPPPL